MPNKILMSIGAHADDIEFWSGGTCLKYHKTGYHIDYIMSTNNMSGQLHIVEKDGSITRKECPPEKMMPIRKSECDKAASLLNTVAIHLDHPQRHYSDANGAKITEGYGIALPGIPMDRPPIMTAHEDKASVSRLAGMILERDPEAVFTHSPVTESPEHYATALLVTKAYHQAMKNGYKGLLLYWNEQTQSTILLRNTFGSWDSFIDISEFRKEKDDLIRCHITMVPFPERMDYIDFSHWCGCAIAEPFNVALFENKPEAIGDFSEEIIRNYKRTFLPAK